jgi:hypothetical protein
MVRLALFLGLLIGPNIALASPIKSALIGAEVRGSATFRDLGFPLYQAWLYTRDGAPLDWLQDFGLELRYLRKLSENDLVASTLDEMARIGSPVPVKDQLKRCFDSVDKGDRYLAISDGPNRVGFWRDGQWVCTLSYPQIKQRFMAIFLGENTQSKSFTRELKGE